MTKDEYFANIHNKISRELGVSVEAIVRIRSFALGRQKLSRGQIVLWVKDKLSLSGKVIKFTNDPIHDCSDCKHLQKVKHILAGGTISAKTKTYQEIHDFIIKATESEWKDMIYEYSYNAEPSYR